MIIMFTMSAEAQFMRIPALDGYPLAATLYPAASAGDSAVIISAATAVPRGFYRHYAGHLAAQGHTVLTYDYRGQGESRPARLGGFSARMRDWAEQDMAAVLAWAAGKLQPRRLFVIGHSFGGQGLGLLADTRPVTAMVTLSAQSGYWGLQPGLEKYRVALSVYLVFPALAHLLGYLPWSRLLRGEDLPKGVALEWARWCRHPDYFFGDRTLASRQNFPRFNAPILAYSFSDDVWGSRRSVDDMMARYTGARVERRHRTPADAGVARLGHVGFFLPSARKLWDEVDEWLR